MLMLSASQPYKATPRPCLYPPCHLGGPAEGSAATDASLVASGIADARIWHKTKVVDVAAGVVIVEEAGGKATDFRGNPLQLGGTEVIVSNGKILPELVAALKA